MQTHYRMVAGLLGLTLALMGGTAMSAATNANGIHVTGRGEVRVEPDIARFSLEVTRQGRTAATLKKELDRITKDVLALARKHKINKKDVIAASVHIQPNRIYNDGLQRIDGVTASRSIQVTLRDLSHIGDFMNAALEAGINNVGNVALDSSRRIELEAQALKQAIADSKDQAGQVAAAYGVVVGGVSNVNVTGQHSVQSRGMVAMEMARGGDESFSAGEIVIHRQVQASFWIGGQ